MPNTESDLLPRAVANVEVCVVDEHWHTYCHEDYCGFEEGYPTFTWHQATKLANKHRRDHEAGVVPVGRSFRLAWEAAHAV